MTTQTYQVMPPLTPEERAALKESIRENGVLVPVEEDEYGNVIDGYNRVELWHELRAEGEKVPDYPRTIRVGLTDAEKRAHARALNLTRRHLNQGQRRQLIADQVKEDASKSDRQIGAALGCDHKTVASVRKELEGRGEIPHVEMREDSLGRCQPARKPTVIAKNATEAKRARRSLEAVNVEDLPVRLMDARKVEGFARRAKWEESRSRQPDAGFHYEGADLRFGDCATVLDDLEGQVDLIVCDPPYVTEFLPVWSVLSSVAARILKPDGLLLAYTGQIHLPAVMGMLAESLDYHWVFVLNHAASRARCYARFIEQSWKPLLAYTRKGCNRREIWISDVIQGSGREKELHQWQQGEGEVAFLIDRLTLPGYLVVDPFLGSGTTAAAAVKLRRRFIGCDINPGAVAITQERLAALTREESA
jgi:site-specific DNA-methyltransferase (adenine-specific)